MTSTLMNDSDIERMLNDALKHEHLPHSIRTSTLDYIHAQASYVSAESGHEVRGEALYLLDRDSSRSSRKHMSRRRFVGLVAAAISTAALATGGVALAHETAEVCVEGNGQIYLGLNRWGRIVRYEASTPELETMLLSLQIYGMPCEDALDLIAADEQIADALAYHDGVVLTARANCEKQLEDTLACCEAKQAAFGRRAHFAYGQNGKGKGGMGYGKHREDAVTDL